jgi:lipid-binding SYLF domain-containing protein
MKKITAICLAMAMALPAVAETKAQLEKKAQKLVAKFESLQQKADKRVPADVLKKAQGIILLDRTKAGFVFAYQGGSGIAMAKDPKSGRWGPLAFLKANEASLGFQIGGQQSFLVILLMDQDSAAKLADPIFEFGGEARGTAGDASAGEEGTLKSAEQSILVYDERQGLFGGAAIKGGEISPDTDANLAYYDEVFSMKEILFGRKVKPSKTAELLAQKIQDYSRK